MASYHLQIVSPDGVLFNADANYLLVRTITGDIGVLSGHISTVTALANGVCRVEADGKTRTAACFGGLLYISKDIVRLMPQIFEWAEDIDTERAKKALDATKDSVAALAAEGKAGTPEMQVLQNRMEREETRLKVAGRAAG